MTPIGQIFTDFVVVNTILNNKPVIPLSVQNDKVLLTSTDDSSTKSHQASFPPENMGVVAPQLPPYFPAESLFL